MYFQPYGNGQQLNLNWIINEIIELHKQLDPDYETPKFSQIYPYSNLEQFNLDWILSELKTLKELAPEPVPQEVDIQAVAEALVALPFDSSKSYQIFDYISRDGEIWRATEAIPAGSAWDGSKWFKTKLGTDLAVLERWINAINADLTTLQNTVEDLSSADISDDSDAGGATVKASLNNLKGSLNTLDTQTNSVEWTPASGDTLLAFILANCTRTKLPFSFIKIGSNTVPDAPTAVQAYEFAGTVYGSARRLTVQIRKYSSVGSSVYQRTIFENNWYDSAWTRYVNTEDLTQISTSSAPLNTDDTFQISNFGSHKVYTIIARRWGFLASVVVPKDFITGGFTANIQLNNSSGQGRNTVLNVSETGLITVSSTDDGIIIGVIASSPIA